MGERRGAYKVLVAKTEGKRPLGKPKPRWEDNTKMDIQEVEWWLGVNDLDQNRDK
jgi:hypothetical protein